MRYFIYVLVVFLIVVQIEVFALLWLNGENLKVWYAQLELNNHIIDSIYER